MGEIVKQQSVETFKAKKRSKRRILVAAILIVVLVAASFGGLAWRRKYLATHQCNGDDNSAIYAETVKLFPPNKYKELEQQVNKIKQQANYKKDASCLYAITRYYLTITDESNAKTWYEQLEKAYAEDPGFVAVYKDYVTKLDDVKKQLDQLQKLTKQSQENRQYFD